MPSTGHPVTVEFRTPGPLPVSALAPLNAMAEQVAQQIGAAPLMWGTHFRQDGTGFVVAFSGTLSTDDQDDDQDDDAEGEQPARCRCPKSAESGRTPGRAYDGCLMEHRPEEHRPIHGGSRDPRAPGLG